MHPDKVSAQAKTASPKKAGSHFENPLFYLKRYVTMLSLNPVDPATLLNPLRLKSRRPALELGAV